MRLLCCLVVAGCLTVGGQQQASLASAINSAGEQRFQEDEATEVQLRITAQPVANCHLPLRLVFNTRRHYDDAALNSSTEETSVMDVALRGLSDPELTERGFTYLFAGLKGWWVELRTRDGGWTVTRDLHEITRDAQGVRERKRSIANDSTAVFAKDRATAELIRGLLRAEISACK